MKAVAALPQRLRSWNLVENWCSLCNEPFGQWNEHRGKKDHIILELFFERLVQAERQWNSAVVLSHFDQRYKDKICVETLFNMHDAVERRRRQDVLHMLQHLADARIVTLSPRHWRDAHFAKLNANPQGALVMFKWMHPHILNMFPDADAAQIGALQQQCSSMYNLETTFDVCGFKHLLKPEDMPVTPHGEVQTELSWAQKSDFMRRLLGQLRWAIDADVPIPKVHTVARACPPHLTVVAEACSHAIVTDMVFCRACEYVSRVEPVWRATLRPKDKPAVTSAPPPLLTRNMKRIIGSGLQGAF